MTRAAALILLLLVLLPCLPARVAAAAPAPGPAAAATLARAQELIDAGRPEEAAASLRALCEGEAPDAQALLLRSTALLMAGEMEAGRRDLDRALELAPDLRQGWLNRAALDLAEGRHDAALAALRRAQQLDPAAADNDLNLGAVLVLTGDLPAASEHFARYVAANPGSAEALYLVATNYGLAGYHALALEHLRQAAALDERMRLRARTDANFADLAATAAFAALLETDIYRPPPGAYQARRAYPVPYAAEDTRLLGAVIDGLRIAGVPADPQVEVASGWALLWGELRVKVSTDEQGAGIVEVTAPAERMTPAQWQERIDRLFQAIAARLAQLSRSPLGSAEGRGRAHSGTGGRS
jgi:tetratricopeptide (TPR) repeat protein